MLDLEAHARAAALNRAKPGALGVVHLVWAPLGPEPLRSFLRSYDAHSAGVAHELVIVLNGALGDADGDADGGTDTGRRTRRSSGAALTRAGLAAELAGIEHRLIVLDRPVPDLAAYGLAARALTHRRLCFLNSYSLILADDWLAIFLRKRSRTLTSGSSAPPPAGRASRAGSAAAPATGPTSCCACAARVATTRAFPTRTFAAPRSRSTAPTCSR